MKAVIYFFSGTGNTLYVAKDLAKAFEGELVPVASLVDSERVQSDGEVVGIVYPVYYGDLPQILKDFTGKLENLEEKYIFAVCTFGGSAGESLKSLRSILESRGGTLAATYGIHMPQNAFYKFWEKHESLYKGWRKKLKTVVKNTGERKTGNYFTNPLFDLIFMGIQSYMRPRYKQSFAKLSGSSPELSVEELVKLNDASFSFTDSCTGCGTCVTICPVGNIELVDERPVWRHNCTNCLACYNYCPLRAITSGIASEGYFYRHPDISASEIMKQKKR